MNETPFPLAVRATFYHFMILITAENLLSDQIRKIKRQQYVHGSLEQNTDLKLQCAILLHNSAIKVYRKEKTA